LIVIPDGRGWPGDGGACGSMEHVRGAAQGAQTAEC
jgi:hypothetical protein